MVRASEDILREYSLDRMKRLRGVRFVDGYDNCMTGVASICFNAFGIENQPKLGCAHVGWIDPIHGHRKFRCDAAISRVPVNTRLVAQLQSTLPN